MEAGRRDTRGSVERGRPGVDALGARRTLDWLEAPSLLRLECTKEENCESRVSSNRSSGCPDKSISSVATRQTPWQSLRRALGNNSCNTHSVRQEFYGFAQPNATTPAHSSREDPCGRLGLHSAAAIAGKLAFACLAARIYHIPSNAWWRHRLMCACVRNDVTRSLLFCENRATPVSTRGLCAAAMAA